MKKKNTQIHSTKNQGLIVNNDKKDLEEYKFNLPKRTDNEIRLVYFGTLRDEENILEIIEEFQKIHKEKTEVLLKIVYEKIHGDKSFLDKINEYIKKGVDGITFKHNLSHRNACYEIATSDIGICWRKNSWVDNCEINNSKMKKYEFFRLNVLTNNYNSNLNCNTLYFTDNNDFYKLLKLYKNNDELISKDFSILYMANTSLPKISGYTIRTKNILNAISKHYKVICFVKPRKFKKGVSIYIIDNIIYYYVNDIESYKSFLNCFLEKSNVKILWSASDNYNGLLCSEISKNNNLNSIYEIRGFWHYSRKYNEECNSTFNETFYNNYNKKEEKACQLNDYVFCENDIISSICNKQFKTPHEKLFNLPNGYNIEDKTYYKIIDDNKKIVFGYIGSIVSYEGLQNLIEQFNKINFKKYNTELLIIGGGSTVDALNTIEKIKILTDKSNHIQYLGQVPFKEINDYYTKIDIICLPRINCLVCNTVAPLKPYEAMGNGKVVLSSSVDAIKGIITHNENGLLFDKNNNNDLYNKIIEILDRKYDLNKISENGFNYCKIHNWDNSIKNILPVLEKHIKI